MFKKIFINLCAERGEAPSAVCKKIGISAAAFSQWDESTVPRKVTQIKIAEYFGVSVDYLLGKVEKPVASEELSELDQQNVYMIPLYETVSAGFGALAISDIVDYIPSYIPNATEASETICIRVRGDSMAPNIENGDIIQVRKQDSVDSGTVAVVLVDGDDGLVKYIMYGETWIELRSINPMYKPMRFNGPDKLRVRVVGLVTKIIKSVSGVKVPVINDDDSENKRELLKLLEILDEDQLKELEKYADYLAAKKK